jgi:hypothetical protein
VLAYCLCYALKIKAYSSVALTKHAQRFVNHIIYVPSKTDPELNGNLPLSEHFSDPGNMKVKTILYYLYQTDIG